MRRPRKEASQPSPEQLPHRSPEQPPQRSPEQPPQGSPEQPPQGSPEQPPQGSPQLMQHRTPEATQQNRLENTPEPHTPDPNTPDESSIIANNNVWEVGTMHSDGRLRVEVISGVLEPSCKCSHRISGIMFERLEPKGFTWKQVSKDTKGFYFEEFKKWFVWKQPDNLIYEGWYKSAAIRYTDLRCRARKQWDTKSELNNRIGRDVWLSWIEDWKTPECKAKSKKKRHNRRGGAEGDGDYPATHTGGSASHRTHTARLAVDWKREPTAFELFELFHTKNQDKVTYIDQKSAAICEKIKSLRAEHAQPTDDGSMIPQPVDENKLFYDAVGGRNKRNRIYGIGNSQNIFYEPSSSTISHFSKSQPNILDYQKLETELQDMKEQIKEMDEVKQRMREMETQLASMREMEARLKRMFDSQNQ